MYTVCCLHSVSQHLLVPYFHMWVFLSGTDQFSVLLMAEGFCTPSPRRSPQTCRHHLHAVWRAAVTALTYDR